MSELRCRQGDLAITENMPMDNGLIVEVLRFVGTPWGWEHLGPSWEVKSLGSEFHMTPTTRSSIAWLPDMHLRPIRPGDGEDEMLTIAGKPEGVAA